jgi:hypothetical protein
MALVPMVPMALALGCAGASMLPRVPMALVPMVPMALALGCTGASKLPRVPMAMVPMALALGCAGASKLPRVPMALVPRVPMALALGCAGASKLPRVPMALVPWSKSMFGVNAGIICYLHAHGVLHGYLLELHFSKHYQIQFTFSHFLTICLAHLLFAGACMAQICLAHLLFACTWGAPWIFVGITFLKTLSNTFYIR